MIEESPSETAKLLDTLNNLDIGPTIESTPTTDFNHESITTINSNHGTSPTTIESPTEPSIQHPC